MNDNPEAKIKVSFNGEEYTLFWGGREARVSHSSVLGDCVEVAA